MLKKLEQKNIKIKNLEEFIKKLTLQINESLDQIDQFKAYHLALEQEYSKVNEKLEILKKNYEIGTIKVPKIHENDDQIIKSKSDLNMKLKEIEGFRMKADVIDNYTEDRMHAESQINKNRFSFGIRESITDIINKDDNGLMRKFRLLNIESNKIDKQV